MKLSTEALLSQLAREDRGDDPVLAAAREVFLEFGIRRSRMGDIAERAAMSPATLYRRYAGKEELATAVLANAISSLLTDLDGAVPTDGPADEQITNAIVLVLLRVRDAPLLTRLLETDPELVLPLITVRGETLMMLGTQFITGQLRRLMTDGRIAELDPAPVAELLTRFIHSLYLTRASSLPLHDEKATRAIVGAIVRRLIPPAG